MNPIHYLPRPLPNELEGLAELALDLRWSWSHGADALWQTVDSELWDVTADPWLILETVSQQRLETLARDRAFLEELGRQLAARTDYRTRATWFSKTHGDAALKRVAYFSMEFGLSEALPIYSGGLGILAGDHLKTCSDLGVPVVGIGMLYQQGYFRQMLSTDGAQLAFFPYNNPAMLPVLPLRDPDGEWIRVQVPLPGRTLFLRGWQAQVGRVPLYLLDSNDFLNSPRDRGITGELYGGGPEVRIQQEIVLGIGGWRLLKELGIECDVCHLNEGHPAFAALERARDLMLARQVPFFTAMRRSRAGNIFTTHTPVAAGFDQFHPDLFRQYFESYAHELGLTLEQLMALGRAKPEDPSEPFNMAYLAVRGSCAVNGVSHLHGKVSRRIFQPLFPGWPELEVPVAHVTNGIHVPSWDSAAADALWTEACGKERWLGDLESVEQDFRVLSDEALWAFRSRGRRALIEATRLRLARQRAAHGAERGLVDECAAMLDANALTMGFARRFTVYKRLDLLLHDRGRLARLLSDPNRPVQLIISGKAHPRDEAGRALIRTWNDYIREWNLGDRVVFIEDYDMAVAADLVQGVDLWLNTPRRPWEASGTSGMKVLVNGGLNLSELDGWWAEAYSPEVGWALGDGQDRGFDPGWDAAEAQALYTLLENEVIPTFYTRDDRGIPRDWVARVRESMARLTPDFSTNRMVREYTRHYYLPCAQAHAWRCAESKSAGTRREAWLLSLDRHWSRLRFGRLDIEEQEDGYGFAVQVYLDELEPDAVRVELYAEPEAGDLPFTQAMERGEALTGGVNSFVYRAKTVTHRPSNHFTPRIVPWHPGIQIPLEVNHILWHRGERHTVPARPGGFG